MNEFELFENLLHSNKLISAADLQEKYENFYQSLDVNSIRLSYSEVKFEIQLWCYCSINQKHTIKLITKEKNRLIKIKRQLRKDLEDILYLNPYNNFLIQIPKIDIHMLFKFECAECDESINLNIFEQAYRNFLNKITLNQFNVIIDDLKVSRPSAQMNYEKFLYRIIQFKPDLIDQVEKKELEMIASLLTHSRYAKICKVKISKLLNYNSEEQKKLFKNFIEGNYFSIDLLNTKTFGKFKFLTDIFIDSNGYGSQENDLIYFRDSDDLRRGVLSGTHSSYISDYSIYNKVLINTSTIQSNVIKYDKIFIGYGRNNSNYWHSLVEYLPSIFSFSQQIKNSNSNDLISCPLPQEMYLIFQQFFESIRLPKNFEIIPFQEGSRIQADTAFFGDWAVSTFENEFSRIKDRMVVNTKLLRSFIHFILSITQIDKSKDEKLSRIIVLRGEDSIRKIKGGLKLKMSSKMVGYVPYNPEKHTFYEQVKVFSQASEIIIEAGSACANLIFCQKETKIIIIIPGTISNDKSVHEILLNSLDIKYMILRLKPVKKKRPLEEAVTYQQTPGKFRTIDLLKILLMKIR